jgi:hypothetical protein
MGASHSRLFKLLAAAAVYDAGETGFFPPRTAITAVSLTAQPSSERCSAGGRARWRRHCECELGSTQAAKAIAGDSRLGVGTGEP